MRLTAPGVSATVDLERGGRLASLEIQGVEVLVGDTGDPLTWGSYPMAPWAGRTRHGRFRFGGRTHRLALSMPPHAIHGTVWLRPWRRLDDTTITTDLGSGWPFAGSVRQRFLLGEGSLRVDMMLHAAETMPAVMGWHPWFRRHIRGTEAVVEFDAGFMLERGPDGVPTGRRVTPGPEPWDDCFGELERFPAVVWPGVLRITIGSTGAWWVVYTEHPDGVCVEPQTGPPDALNHEPRLVEAGGRIRMSMEWRWALD